MIDTILWNRLDAPGHDACRLEPADSGWRLNGTAAFLHEGIPACLAYQVACDGRWQTTRGIVQGWVGTHSIDWRIERTDRGVWLLDGEIATHIDAGILDLDLGFTPATNLIQLRRVALQIGQAAAVPVAWLDAFVGTFDVLHQHYERRTRSAYWYAAPRFDYTALLEVGPTGFIHRYPGLWEVQP